MRKYMLVCIVLLALIVAPISAFSSSPFSVQLHSSYYELLEVNEDVDASALKKSYRAAALKYHPDRYLDPAQKAEMEERFVIIAEAFEVLSDPDRRKEYDLLLENGYLRYDPHEYRLLVQRKNEMYAGGGGGGVYYRRHSPEDEDDTVVFILSSIIGILIITLPFYGRIMQIYEKYRKQRKLKADKVAERARRKALEDQLAQLQHDEHEHDEEEIDDEAIQDSNDAVDVADAAVQAEREAKRKAREQQRKMRMLLRRMCTSFLEQQDKSAPSPHTPNTPNTPILPSDIDLLCTLPHAQLESCKSSYSLCHSFSLLHTNPLLIYMYVYIVVSALWNLMENNPKDGISSDVAEHHAPIVKAHAFHFPTLSLVSSLLTSTLLPLHQQQAALANEQAALAASKQTIKIGNNHNTGSNGTLSSGSNNAERAWTELELSLLAKGTAKFPGGAAQRWERITALINHEGGNRSMKQVIGKVKSLEVEKIVGKKDEGAAKRYLEEKGIVSSSLSSSSSSAPTSAASIATAVPAANNASASSVPAHTTDEEWSQEQQSALEEAMKSACIHTAYTACMLYISHILLYMSYVYRRVPKTAEDRWDQIAASVPGKTRKQVLNRVKAIKAQIQAARQ